MANAEPAFYTTGQLARDAGVHPNTIRLLIHEGKLPAIKPRGQFRIPAAAAHKLLEQFSGGDAA